MYKLKVEKKQILVLILDHIRSTVYGTSASVCLYIGTGPTVLVISTGGMSPLTLALLYECG